ncbi:hypothetical protein MLD38_021066 [Melastoma candidum]|uniref:Uncharacterized protein n=1 Tax=Melastoma candidum TaxID=119954 RepID=A0ACB9QFG1_9MYRT|nr:hypothetical protein MLD38_021066 [Melastoma candidum]
MEIKPFLTTFFILAVTVAALSPAIDASSGKDKEADQGSFIWYPTYSKHGNKCDSSTWWGKSVCLLKGSGLTCCKHKCVNLKKDDANCGSCGRVCHYNTKCCNGKCVNVISNAYHCGQCNKKCPYNVKCENRVCGYAS